MKTGTKTKSSFAEMPQDYAALCRMHLPRPIHDKGAYENALEIAEVFAGFESAMSADQTDYFDLISSLIEAWEAAHVRRPKTTPVGMLKHLLEEHGLTAAGLSRILQSSPKLGAMILRGERSITADHARTLGEYFKLSPAAFL